MPEVMGVRLAGEQTGSIEMSEKKVVSRYTLEFVVQADNTSQGVITIRSTVGLPIVGLSPYSYQGESDPFAICKRKTPRRDSKHPLVWYVRCEFDDDPNSQAEQNETNQDSAPSRPPIYTWGSVYGEEVLEKDYSTPRKDVVTPIGHAFDPPLTRRVIYPRLTVERFQLAFTPATILGYVDHVNNAPFMGADAEHALMADIQASQVIEDAVKLWRVTYVIDFAVQEDGFKAMPLNQDYQFRPSAGSDTLESFPFGRLGNLNADGTKAATGVHTYGGKDQEGFKRYPRANFNALGLV
jgi:hypothetical protein